MRIKRIWLVDLVSDSRLLVFIRGSSAFALVLLFPVPYVFAKLIVSFGVCSGVEILCFRRVRAGV